MPDIDWEVLRDSAKDALRFAYAPYSEFPVGAAGLTGDGTVVTGCNVENVSYGLGVCAENTLVGNLRMQGGTRLRAVSVCDRTGTVLTPCGRCRQVLLEHGGPDLLIDHLPEPVPLRVLLPDAFGPDDLERVT